MITKFKIYENVNHGKLYKILTEIVEDENKLHEIENYIGFDFNYKILYSYDDDFELIVDNSFEKFVGLEENSIEHVLHLANSYSNYEYYIDREELNYINSYLDKNSMDEIKKLAKYAGIDVDINKEGGILELFEYLGLYNLIEDIENEIRMEHERAVEKTAHEVINHFPFDINFASKFPIKLSFEIRRIISDIEEKKIIVDTLKEYIEHIDFSEISYDLEHEHYENLGDFKDINIEVYNKVQDYIIFPEILLKEFVMNDDLELLKKHIEDANFTEKYNYWHNYNRVNETLFEIAKTKNEKILKFFKSYEFQKWFMKNENIERYKQLIENEIINNKIKNEYAYLISVEKYNL